MTEKTEIEQLERLSADATDAQDCELEYWARQAENYSEVQIPADDLFAIISRALRSQRSEWREISSAPKDGTVFLALPGHVKCKWIEGQNLVKDGWNEVPLCIGFEPTHWMPFPPPPTQSAPADSQDGRVSELEAEVARLADALQMIREHYTSDPNAWAASIARAALKGAGS